jgi:monoamine oxidase
VTAVVTHQNSDPYQLGSYSSVPVGASLADLDALAVPIDGVLVFAGEHTTSAFYGWAHGAWLSGERAGADVIALRAP